MKQNYLAGALVLGERPSLGVAGGRTSAESILYNAVVRGHHIRVNGVVRVVSLA